MDENSAALSGTEAAGDTESAPSPAREEDAAAPEEERREAAPDGTSGPPEDAIRAERARLAGERERTAAERARLVAEDQVRRIGELDSEIKSLDDLMDMPEYDGFYALVKKGVSLVDAYKLARYDRLVKRAADAAARQTMRSLGSRRHLTALAGRPGAGEYVSVPAEVAAEYRLAKPGITDDEIRRKYRKYQKYQRQ